MYWRRLEYVGLTSLGRLAVRGSVEKLQFPLLRISAKSHTDRRRPPGLSST